MGRTLGTFFWRDDPRSFKANTDDSSHDTSLVSKLAFFLFALFRGLPCNTASTDITTANRLLNIMRRLTVQAYMVGWLCALPLSELVVAIAMLDEEHDPLSPPAHDETLIPTVLCTGMTLSLLDVCIRASQAKFLPQNSCSRPVKASRIGKFTCLLELVLQYLAFHLLKTLGKIFILETS